jgi:cell division protein YceG involved in septum cleavage
MNTIANSRISYSEQRIINNRTRRERELKRRILIFSISLILFVIAAVLTFSIKSVASDGSEAPLYKHYVSVQISAGDSVYDLAKEYYTEGYDSYDSLIDEIIFINNLSDESVLKTGNYLVIPTYKN